MELSWSMRCPPSWMVEIYGTEGSIFLGWDELVLKKEGKGEREKYPSFDPFEREVIHFINCVLGKDGLQALRVVEAAYRSAREGKMMPISLPH